MIHLERTKKSDEYVQYLMSMHYSHPKGFVGRSLIYRIYNGIQLVGVIVGGSATLHLPGRNEFFGSDFNLNHIINNTFFHIENNYDDKNIGTKILSMWRKQVIIDWREKYEDDVIGFETLVELPRSGSLYKADNWTQVGITKGYTCRRVSGQEKGVFGGKRIWNTNIDELRPKLVFCKKC